MIIKFKSVYLSNPIRMSNFTIERMKKEDKDYFESTELEAYRIIYDPNNEMSGQELKESYEQYDADDPLDPFDDHHQVFIAKSVDKRPLGVVWIANREPFWKYESNMCWMYNLFVNPEERGKGIATKLMEKAEQWAKEQNLELIALHTADHAASARRLYEKLGYSLVHTHNWSCFYEKKIEI